jgi:hypothetical protein
VRGILDFIVNWCGFFEKPVMVYNLYETGFTSDDKPLKILSGKEKAASAEDRENAALIIVPCHL